MERLILLHLSVFCEYHKIHMVETVFGAKFKTHGQNTLLKTHCDRNNIAIIYNGGDNYTLEF
jgi:hypothetical protein